MTADFESMPATRSSDTRIIRELMLRKIGRAPRRATDIFAAVREDFGSVCERRLWRNLTHLIASGAVVRIPGALENLHERTRPGVRGNGHCGVVSGYVRARGASS